MVGIVATLGIVSVSEFITIGFFEKIAPKNN